MKLGMEFETRDMGEVKWFLGMRIIRNWEESAIYLCQDSYIEKIAKRFNYNLDKLPPTPIPESFQFKKFNGQATSSQIHVYQQKVGSLQFAAKNMRPDIAFAASKLSEFMINPAPEHMDVADRSIKYLYWTRYLANKFKAPASYDPDTCLQIAGDAAFADNPDRKSSGGYLFKLYGGSLDWMARKQ